MVAGVPPAVSGPTRPLLAVVGPTATGKSALALRLAAGLGGEIVNADALQVYRGLDIGTAKPGPADRRRVPHHLLDILEPSEPYSAGEFARRARRAIAEIRQRGGLPIVVGGSGLYLRALFGGLSPLPPRQPALRRVLERRLEGEGIAALRQALAVLDPPTAARLAPGDRQRTVRALEVVLASGRPLSAWHAARPRGQTPLAALRIGLTLPRTILYDRIADRVRRMFREGWVEEVAGLLARGVSPSAPGFQAIGYRQIAACLCGKGSLQQAAEEIVRMTCRFAKRQATWYRREPGIVWLTADDDERLPVRVMALMQEAGAMGSPS